MELWIRSQNKHCLIKAYDLQLDSFNVKKDKVLIINSRTKTDCCYLAEYDTEERALEVLDEIQHELGKRKYGYPTYEDVYEMPEE